MVLRGVKDFAKLVAQEYKDSRERAQAQAQAHNVQQNHPGSNAWSSPVVQPPLPPRSGQQGQQQQQLQGQQAHQPPQANNTSTPNAGEEPMGRGSPNCPGFNRAIGTECYVSPAILEFDICTACYDAHIASTCFANRVSRVPNTSDGRYCNFSIRADRDAWTEACMRASLPSATLEDQSNWLEYYKQQSASISAKIKDIGDRRTTINNELPALRQRYKAEDDAAWRQTRHSLNMMAASSMVDSPQISSNVGSDLANERGLNAERIALDIRQKEDMMNRILVEQLRQIVA